jgi:peptide methionine sulfoxide reductase MsrB
MFRKSKGCQTPDDWFPKEGSYPVMGTEKLMQSKEHGTSNTPVQKSLRYGCDIVVADRICNFNRHYAEYSGYFLRTNWLNEISKNGDPTTYYDSNSGSPLFQAPGSRSFVDFLHESKAHGWPSFRDDEVNWKFVRVLPDGECVSIDGTHLGHNIPDAKGNRYCINLVSIAGSPAESKS